MRSQKGRIRLTNKILYIYFLNKYIMATRKIKKKLRKSGSKSKNYKKYLTNFGKGDKTWYL